MSNNVKSNLNREIITVNVGGCGINLGESTLEQYCVEQGISSNGDKELKTENDSSIPISFRETIEGKYVARSLFIDSDPYSINMMKNIYKYNKVIDSNYLISGKTDCHNNYALGHYAFGRDITDTINNKLRLLVEQCDNTQGFIIQHSMSGGTGGGLGTLILERIAVDYRKKCKFGFESLYDNHKSTGPFQIYNSLLTLHWLLDHTEVSIILDNVQLQQICSDQLKIKTPRFKHYNYLCNKLMSTITAPFRFGLKEDLMSFAKDMVIYPRLHFLMASMWPIIPKLHKNKKQIIYKDDIRTLTNQCVTSKNFFQSFTDFDAECDYYLSLSFSYRGDNIKRYMYDINKYIERIKKDRNKISYLYWCNDEPSVKYINSSVATLSTDDMITGDHQSVMVGNNLAISHLFANRISKLYDTMYSQRAYEWSYVALGMEVGEFAEAREDLGFLEKDYLDVCTDYCDDETESEDEDEIIDNDENI